MQRSSRFFLRALIVVGAIAFLIAGFSRISFNVDILRLLPTNLKQVEGLSLFLKHFAQPNELIVTLEGSDADVAAAAAKELAGEFQKHPEIIKRAVAEPPWEENPAKLAEFLAFLILNQPPEKIQEIAANLRPENTAATLEATKSTLAESISPQEVAMLSYDPYGLTRALAFDRIASTGIQSEFSFADGAFRVIYVETTKPFATYKDTIAWVNRIKEIAHQW